MKTIYKKLLNVKTSLGPIVKEITNAQYGFSYASLPSIFRACNDALIEEGLIIDIEAIIPDTAMSVAMGKPYFIWCVSVVDTENGDKLQKHFTFPSQPAIGGRMNEVQAMGSSITYGTKYIYSAILSIQFEEDPDGQVREKVEEAPKEWLTAQQLEATKKSTPKQIKAVLKAYDGTAGKVMKKEYREALIELLKD